MLSRDDVNMFLLSPMWGELKSFIKKDDKETLDELIQPDTHDTRRAYLSGIRAGYLNILKFIDRRAEIVRLYEKET